MNLKKILAYNSFYIIKIIFGVSFIGIVILNYYVLDEIPVLILYIFCFISGIYLGYSIAYMSIKFLKHFNESNDWGSVSTLVMPHWGVTFPMCWWVIFKSQNIVYNTPKKLSNILGVL